MDKAQKEKLVNEITKETRRLMRLNQEKPIKDCLDQAIKNVKENKTENNKNGNPE